MIGLDLIAAHMVGDYILQTDEMAREKLTSRAVRIVHCIYYALPMALVAQIHSDSPARRTWFFILVILTHYLVDSRRWASGDKWPPKPILVDQALHLVTLALLGRIL